jgi:hypothetical protein
VLHGQPLAAELVDEILAGRQSKTESPDSSPATVLDGSAIIAVRPGTPHHAGSSPGTGRSDFERQRAGIKPRREGAQTEREARQQTIEEEYGEEIQFVTSLMWHVGGGSLSKTVQALKHGSHAVWILKGQSCYESGRWNYQWVQSEGCVPPTPDARKALSERFRAAARKLVALGNAVRSGKADGSLRERLREEHLLTKGGKHGRWMCDGLAVEMYRIANQIE